MTAQRNDAPSMARRPWRSAAAVLLGLLAVVLLSTITDLVLHAIGYFPPAGQPMSNTLFGIATAYRLLYGIAGGYIAARFAPDRPVWHAFVLGLVGLVISIIGAAVSWNHPELGPRWYPLALVVTALPCSWLGGILYRVQKQL